MKIKEFIKKYHILPYVFSLLAIIVVAYGIKWYRYGEMLDGFGNDAVFLYRYYRIIVLIFILAFTIIYYLAVVRRAAFEKIILAVMISVGFMYMFIVTPNSAADETKHMYAVTSYANVLTGVDKAEEDYTYFTRYCDANTGLTQDISRGNYVIMGRDFFKSAADGKEYVPVQCEVYNYNAVSFIFYLPAIIGVVLGRIFSFGGILTYMLARLFMLLAYSFLSYMAIKKLPCSKLLMALVMILPTSLSRAACVNEDAIIHPVAFIFVAYVMSFITSDNTIRTKDAVVCTITGVILAMSKGGIYIPLLMLLFMVPKKNFGKAKYPAVVSISIAVSLVAFIVANPTLLSDFANQGGELIYTEATGYTLGGIITSPKASALMLFSTFFNKIGVHYAEMIGSGFGWLQVYVSDTVIVLFTVLMVIGALNVEGKEFTFDGKQRIFAAVIAALGLVLIIMSMWIFWTPMGTPFVVGIQGRYFIPYLFILLFLFKNKSMIIKKDLSTALVMVAVALQGVTFLEIWVRI